MTGVEEILDGIVKREGGFVDHPLDRGGPTKFGITLRTLAAWRQAPQTIDHVRKLTKEEAKEIYRERYVAPFEGDVVPSVLPQVIDIGVLHGVGTAKRMIAKLKGEGRLTNRGLLAERLDLIADIVKNKPEQRVFLKGWLRRCLEASELV
jgi:lysozyme family protein